MTEVDLVGSNFGYKGLKARDSAAGTVKWWDSGGDGDGR